jgi:heme/copper-type cytochrome/quinol oxidase subunit 2
MIEVIFLLVSVLSFLYFLGSMGAVFGFLDDNQKLEKVRKIDIILCAIFISIVWLPMYVYTSVYHWSRYYEYPKGQRKKDEANSSAGDPPSL